MMKVWLLSAFTIAAFSSFSQPTLACDRDSFGNWQQKDLMTTRQIVLQRDGRELDWFEYANGAFRIVRGTWTDRLTGKTHFYADAKQIEVDHVIPVCFAWHRGAKDWGDEKKVKFYNDLEFLIVASKTANNLKSDSPPWIALPPNKALACEYVQKFRHGVQRYSLSLTNWERNEMLLTESRACASEIAPSKP